MAAVIRNFQEFLSSQSKNKRNGSKSKQDKIREDICLIANLRNICKQSPNLITGKTLEEESAIWQWVEYYQINIGEDVKQAFDVLQDLNIYLISNSFLVGNNFTAADYVVYHGLHNWILKLSAEERERFVNVCRWFDLVQHHPFVRQHRAVVTFSKTPLYSTAYKSMK